MILPIKWHEEKTWDGLVELTALDLFKVYECRDGTWRIYFECGYETSEGDQKIRNIASREEAIAKANTWWAEFLADKIT